MHNNDDPITGLKPIRIVLGVLVCCVCFCLLVLLLWLNKNATRPIFYATLGSVLVVTGLFIGNIFGRKRIREAHYAMILAIIGLAIWTIVVIILHYYFDLTILSMSWLLFLSYLAGEAWGARHSSIVAIPQPLQYDEMIAGAIAVLIVPGCTIFIYHPKYGMLFILIWGGALILARSLQGFISGLQWSDPRLTTERQNEIKEFARELPTEAITSLLFIGTLFFIVGWLRHWQIHSLKTASIFLIYPTFRLMIALGFGLGRLVDLFIHRQPGITTPPTEKIQ